MEAVYESEHRMNVNLGTGYVGRVSVLRITTHNIRPFLWRMRGYNRVKRCGPITQANLWGGSTRSLDRSSGSQMNQTPRHRWLDLHPPKASVVKQLMFFE
jgi:hypothetical protein